MSAISQPAAPTLLREHEDAIHELGHIATLFRELTERAGPINPDVAGAMSFLAYLASDRTDALCKALSGAGS